MEKQIIMQMQHITKRFPGVLALDDVNFEAYAGEILALCGENGAGKSTLMKILSGSYPRSAYEGKILIEGKECRFTDTEKSERAGIAMIIRRSVCIWTRQWRKIFLWEDGRRKKG